MGCSSSSAPTLTPEKLEKIRERDELILNSLHSEPQKQGSKEIVTEDGITTEIWRSKTSHGDKFENTETLIYKNGKLISHSFKDGHTGFVGSKQFHDGKVVQYTEETAGKATVVYFDAQENIAARLMYAGKDSECLVYDGKIPRPEKFETCEEKFNTSP